jgi:hypothetical protein
MADSPVQRLLATLPKGSGGVSDTWQQAVTALTLSSTNGRNETDSQVVDHLTRLGSQLAALQSATQAQTSKVNENTKALYESSQSRGATSVLADAGKMAAGVFGSGLFLSPILSGILKLFGSKGTPSVPELVRYEKPAPIQLSATLRSATERVVEDRNAYSRQVAQTPVTIQVQAIDSRSFLDHSDAIARAVKQALLESHDLGQVIREL